MSSYSFELLPDEPILIATIYSSFTLRDDLDPHLNEANSILDHLDRPVCYIINVHQQKLNAFQFQDFLVGFNRGFGKGSSINHPNIKAMIIVSTDILIKLGAKGLNSAIFGYLSVPVFDTLEEALAHARELVEQE